MHVAYLHTFIHTFVTENRFQQYCFWRGVKKQNENFSPTSELLFHAHVFIIHFIALKLMETISLGLLLLLLYFLALFNWWMSLYSILLLSSPLQVCSLWLQVLWLVTRSLWHLKSRWIKELYFSILCGCGIMATEHTVCTVKVSNFRCSYIICTYYSRR